MTRSLSAEQFFHDVREPLVRAISLLGPHLREIDAAWHARLSQFVRRREEAEALSALSLGGQFHHLEVRNFAAFCLAFERQGQALASRDVIEEHAISALGFYLESCLPFVHVPGEPQELGRSLVRATFVAQVFLLSGYASARAIGWRALDEQERHRLSRDLHDEIGANLVVLKLYMEMMATDLVRGRRAAVSEKVQEALALVSQAIDSVRRLILDLGPAILEEVGLLPAVRLYARQFSARTGTAVHVAEKDFPERLPASYETALYRVIQGALSNVVKHSHARKVSIRLGSLKDSELVMVIEDDGVGFEATKRAPSQSFGLMSMRHRIDALGGRFHAESWPAGPGRKRHGTRIEVDLPWGGQGKS